MGISYKNENLFSALYYRGVKCKKAYYRGEVLWEQDKSITLNNSAFLDKASEYCELSDIYNIKFTKTAIPKDVSDRTDVSSKGSYCKAYLYYYGGDVVVSPEIDNIPIYAPSNSNSLFQGLDVPNMNFTNLYFDRVSDASYMFNGCSILTSLDGSKFNNTNFKNTSYMFSGCKALKTLDVSNWNMYNVTNMEAMFRYCNISTLDVSGWNVYKCANFDYMFADCKLLVSLETSNWDPANLQSVVGMFSGCSKLKYVDMSGWINSDVTSLVDIFNNCSNLRSLDVLDWDVSNVTNMTSAFTNCSMLTSLDTEAWDTSKLLYTGSTYSGGIFEECNVLTIVFPIMNTKMQYTYDDKGTTASVFRNCSTEDGSRLTIKSTSGTKDYAQKIYNNIVSSSINTNVNII